MTQTRRTFLAQTAAAGTVAALPIGASAGGHSANEFATPAGPITVHPIHHASVVLETPNGVLYIDPTGDAAQYADKPAPDAILFTHHHGDHINAELLTVLKTPDMPMIVNPVVYEELTEDQKATSTVLANGDSGEILGVGVDAIPAYNMTEGRTNFHPQGRDNGYVLTFDGFRMYFSGDTEGTPEMRALENIDVAFVCMNLPFTMSADAAAEAVNEFAPKFVYPYHYRGRDGGTQDPEYFATLLTDATEIRYGDWYRPGELG